MVVDFRLPVSTELLNDISQFDRFQGRWSGQPSISAERLRRIGEATRTVSVGASCRLAGIRVTDAEVAAVLRGEGASICDAGEILGYAEAMRRDPLPASELLSGDFLRTLHAEILGRNGAVDPSPWRTHPLHREAFDADGKASGHVFPSLPPRFVQRKTEELVTWLELELRTRQQHPVLVTATFVLCLLAISPFESANGRLARLLGGLLLLRAGYSAIPYASLELGMEELRVDYHESISRSQTGLWTDEPSLEPWLTFFVKVLGRHRDRLQKKISLEREVQDYPPLQQAILEAVREHGTVDAGLLLLSTGANRNTLKDNLRRLVQRGVLEKIGQRRGTRYRISTGEQQPVEAGSLTS